ncbi:hypothetical protein KCP78_22550 [Salmonella enterica subsp. enterica]|nr:hypothetical protein KCP78_22550 [Salmonella enterica subsp. enterica]
MTTGPLKRTAAGADANNTECWPIAWGSTFDWITTVMLGQSWRHNPRRGTSGDFKARRIDKWQEK